MIFDDFLQSDLHSRWTTTGIGGGTVSLTVSTLHMAMPSAQEGRYTDAQIDDYAGRVRSQFPWQPPLRMEVRARASHPAATASTPSTSTTSYLHGTAGFGFWNYPFSVRGDILMLPEAIWFFYASPPSNMALVPNIPGWGWKAQVVHSMSLESLAALVPTALSAGWARVTGQGQPAAHWLHRLSGASEALINADITEWHTYILEWRPYEARFWVNEQLILTVPNPPKRPLGFVAWLDNQYAVATPRGELRFGTVSSGPQWLALDSIKIEPLM